MFNARVHVQITWSNPLSANNKCPTRSDSKQIKYYICSQSQLINSFSGSDSLGEGLTSKDADTQVIEPVTPGRGYNKMKKLYLKKLYFQNHIKSNRIVEIIFILIKSYCPLNILPGKRSQISVSKY